MPKTTFAFLSLSLVIAITLAGCGEAPIPSEPSFAVDVRPILIAHCVRCHGAGGKLNGDPDFARGTPASSGYFAQYEDSGSCDTTPQVGCKRGALYFTMFKGLLTGWLRNPDDAGRMPPPPSDRLTERQIQIIERWAAEASPKP